VTGRAVRYAGGMRYPMAAGWPGRNGPPGADPVGSGRDDPGRGQRLGG